jgi:hypothetical protein
MLRKRLSVSLVLLLLTSLLAAPAVLGKGGGGFGGGRSFSGGSRSVGVRPGGFSGSRSFSPGRVSPAPSRGTFKPSGGFLSKFDSGAASAQRAQSSRNMYERANGIFNGGRTSSAERVGPVTDETLQTRPSRQETIFGHYYRQPVTTVYHDSFNPWFWLWLLDRSQHDRDLWVYNHRDEMDQSRYNDLVQKDADLERRLHDLEQQGVTKDPSYTPPGVDQDLMYNDKEVQQVHTEDQHHPEWGMFFGTLAVIGGAYLVFFVPMFKPRRRFYR